MSTYNNYALLSITFKSTYIRPGEVDSLFIVRDNLKYIRAGGNFYKDFMWIYRKARKFRGRLIFVDFVCILYPRNLNFCLFQKSTKYSEIHEIKIFS